jgi:hypothetical protein
MKRLVVLLAIVAATTAVIGAMSVGSASSPARKRETTVHIIQTATSMNISGPVISIVQDETLPNGQHFGTAFVYCITIQAPKAECVATHMWAKGEVAAEGPFDPTQGEKQTVAVIGGTGAYRGAKGEIDVTVSPQRNESIFHIDKG